MRKRPKPKPIAKKLPHLCRFHIISLNSVLFGFHNVHNHKFHSRSAPTTTTSRSMRHSSKGFHRNPLRITYTNKQAHPVLNIYNMMLMGLGVGGGWWVVQRAKLFRSYLIVWEIVCDVCTNYMGQVRSGYAGKGMDLRVCSMHEMRFYREWNSVARHPQLHQHVYWCEYKTPPTHTHNTWSAHTSRFDVTRRAGALCKEFRTRKPPPGSSYFFSRATRLHSNSATCVVCVHLSCEAAQCTTDQPRPTDRPTTTVTPFRLQTLHEFPLPIGPQNQNDIRVHQQRRAPVVRCRDTYLCLAHANMGGSCVRVCELVC